MVSGSDVPDVGVSDPPAFAVKKKFEAVDGTALHRAGRRRHVLGGAEQMDDVACAMGDAVDFMFVEGFTA